MKIRWLVLMVVAAGAWLALSHGARAVWAADNASAATIQDLMDVGMEYTLTVDGAVVDSTDRKQPFHYIHGKGQIVPGLERQLVGLKVGDIKEVTVSPEDGVMLPIFQAGAKRV